MILARILALNMLDVVLKCSNFAQVDQSDLGNELMKRPRVLIASVEFLSSTEAQMLVKSIHVTCF